MERIGRQFFKSEMPIERPGAVILCMHDEGADAGNIGRLQCAKDGVAKQFCPVALALPSRLHRQAGKQHDRHRMPGKSLAHSLWGIGMAYFADDQRIEADNHIV